MLRLSLQLHKWIALVVAIQVLGWVAGGLIMIALPIERVRGENHIGAPALAPIDTKRLLPLERQLALADMADVGEATLKNTPRGPIWVLNPPPAARVGGTPTAARTSTRSTPRPPGATPRWRTRATASCWPSTIKRTHPRKPRSADRSGAPVSATGSTPVSTLTPSPARCSAGARTYGRSTTSSTRSTS